MGTGKSTVGQLVATIMDRKFVDTDVYINSAYGPVSDILNKPDGDERFKRLEESVAVELSEQKDLVIATGGRV